MPPPMPSFDWLLALWGLLGAAILQAVLWVVARRRANANWVDVGWAGSLLGMVVLYALAGPGAAAQRLLIGGVAGVWAGRLTWHLLRDRVVGKPEDGRYGHLRAHWGAHADAHFAWFFEAQAILAALLSLVFLVAAHNPAGEIAILQWAGLSLFVLAEAGEAIADRQLARWRENPANRGRTCREGLWRYSRHPNYFFEWLIWCAFALIATPAPHGGWTWLAPLVMYLLITRVTGIPYTELQALRSRGEDYAAYQRTTSAFFPWFPRTT